MNQLLIRTDATARMGTGHVMRCLALAEAWHGSGGYVTFLSHCLNDGLTRMLDSKGLTLLDTPRPHPDPADLQATLAVIEDRADDRPWVVLDGYHFDEHYHRALRAACSKVMVIDDFNHLPRYHADVLLNQNIGAEHLSYSADQDTTLLLGTRYAILRSEFRNRDPGTAHFPETATNLLVTLGGSDPDNVTLKVLQALAELDVDGLQAKVVVGPANRNRETLKQYGQAAELLDNPAMPELMAWADLAISAGGTTCWELAFMGVPCLVLTLAENQEGIAEGLTRAGAAVSCGWARDVTVGRLREHLRELVLDRALREECARASQCLVDGLGVQRVIQTMGAVA